MKTLAIFLEHPGLSSLTMSPAQAATLAARLGGGVRVRHCLSEREFLEALPAADWASTWTFRQEWFALAPRLRLVSTPAAGKDYFSVEWPEGVLHWNGGFHGELMGETAVAMLLGMCRGLLAAVTTFREDPWPRSQVDARMRPLRGSTVAICGFGKIGRWAGRLLKPFGTRLLGVSLHGGHPAPDYFTPGDRCCTVEELDGLLPQADHLLLVLPRSPATDHFLDRRRLALLPPHATVTNLGRGNAIDEEALVQALSAGRLAGACLDVCAQEPLSRESPLRQCPNLWLTPHSSAFSPTYMDAYARELEGRLRQEGLLP